MGLRGGFRSLFICFLLVRMGLRGSFWVLFSFGDFLLSFCFLTQAYYVAQVGLELTVQSSCLSLQVLGSQTCTTRPGRLKVFGRRGTIS